MSGWSPGPNQCDMVKWHRLPDGSRVQRRCLKRSVAGSTRCPTHLGWRETCKPRQNVASRKVGGLPEVYSKFLSSTLRERLEELAVQGAKEAKIDDELQLSRATLVDCAQMYDLAMLAYESEVNRGSGPGGTDGRSVLGMLQDVLRAGSILRSAIDHVADLAERKVRMETMRRRGDLPVEAVQDVVDQVVYEMYQELGDSEEAQVVVERVAERLREARLPGKPTGTDVLPPVDEQVRQMDESIPRVTHEQRGAA